jgi:hypothetical protein
MNFLAAHPLFFPCDTQLNGLANDGYHGKKKLKKISRPRHHALPKVEEGHVL